MDAHRSETWFFAGLLAIAFFFSWMILAPYMGALVLAGTLAFLFRPLYQRFLRVLHFESLAAFCTVLVATLIVFIPLGYFCVRIFGEATALYAALASHGGFDFGAALTNFLRDNSPGFPTPSVVINFNAYAQQALTWLIQNLGSFFSGVTQIFFTAFLSLFGLFYILKDGARLKKWTLDIIPLGSEYTEGIISEMEAVLSSVLKGTLMVAVILGVIMGLGFFIFHIPDPAFWGALVVPASIIPFVGTWLVVVPVIAYLFITGQTVLGIGLAIWSVVLVNIIYNVLSPQLMHRGMHIHPFLILLSVLGGLGLFGPIGFLMGPLVLAFLFSLLKIYTKLTVRRA
jgi:predicted PurR-regulated permease PerM